MRTASRGTPISKAPTSSLRRVALAVSLVLASALAVACSPRPPRLAPVPVDEAAQPILVLVSLDGWRWDYLERSRTPHLDALAQSGVRSEGLIPAFPSKTFPNHYTIVTGLYPEHHGIVSNNMIDSSIGERFSMSAPTAKDTRWWGGEPLWITATRQGRRSASMFWPGSDVEINGARPTYWKLYDGNVPNRQRVQQVLAWLSLPEQERPSFLTLYFSDMDTVGHRSGPESPEVLETATALDREIGVLVDGVKSLGLSSRVHFVIVSDHGMSQISTSRLVVLDDYLDMDTVNVVDSSPVLGLWPRAGTAEDIYLALKDKHPSLTVYRRADVPEALRYNTNARIPPVIGIAAEGWSIVTRAQAEAWRRDGLQLGGTHGYDPSARSMHGLFIAAGPQFRRGVTIPPLENVHLYEMMARILGLSPAANDGDADETNGLFSEPGFPEARATCSPAASASMSGCD